MSFKGVNLTTGQLISHEDVAELLKEQPEVSVDDLNEDKLYTLLLFGK